MILLLSTLDSFCLKDYDGANEKYELLIGRHMKVLRNMCVIDKEK